MADTKISGLTAQSAALATDDLLVVVDTSDTSMAATGTDKKLSAGGAILPQMHLMLWNLGVR